MSRDEREEAPRHRLARADATSRAATSAERRGGVRPSGGMRRLEAVPSASLRLPHPPRALGRGRTSFVAAAALINSSWVPSSTTRPSSSTQIGRRGDRGEAVRDEDRGAVPRRGEDPIEIAAFRARRVAPSASSNDARAHPDRRERPGRGQRATTGARDPCCASAARGDRVEASQAGGTADRAPAEDVSCPGGCGVILQRPFEAAEVWNAPRRPPALESSFAQIDAVDPVAPAAT